MEKLDRTPPPYAALAEKIVRGRAACGLTQAELAAALGFRQQTVSRWEAGTHRPKSDELGALAKLIGEDLATLMGLAGHGAVTRGALPMFPVDALDPAAFEHFVADVVEALEPGAEARVQGGRGHNQAGTDIIATLPDGKRWSLQCKRVEQFGPAEAKKAIAKHEVMADRKFLVLSKVASPALAKEVEAREGWTLWDQQDLTRVIRSLAMVKQERLVDIYFPGQRMALLGRHEPGPWRTDEEYFRPFEGRQGAISHDWALVGRQEEIATLGAALSDDASRISLLVGAAGMGKTRLLKEVVRQYRAEYPEVDIHFLASSQDPTASSLADLGQAPKLLVVDDAHDRDGLPLVIEYVLRDGNARLLIATRRYAEQRILNELSCYNIVEPHRVALDRLTKPVLRELVIEVLEEFGGYPQWADAVLSVASDNPLVAAMAARVVARDGKIPDLAVREGELQRIILSRFAEDIIGHIGMQRDADMLGNVLNVLALIQPFHIDDRRVAELVAVAYPGIAATDVTRALRQFVDGGVIYKRGQLYRLMPDLLGDFLIDRSCIGADTRLTPFAMQIADAVEGDRLTQVLVNLGRMDWRRVGGDPSNSDLLDPIWRKLHISEDRYDRRIAAVRAVAYYQPRQALDFIQARIEHGTIPREVGDILKRVAYTPEYRADALRLLWDLGRDDKRALNSNTDHPIRVLAELVSYERNKPLSVNQEVADFGLSLLDQPDAWTGHYTPFDVLEALLKGEGMEAESRGRSVAFGSFLVDYDRVAHLRAQVIDRTFGLLIDERPQVAYLAATFLSHALRGPMGLMGNSPDEETLKRYDVEFGRTITRIEEFIAEGRLAPTTVIGLVRSLDWYASYHKGDLGDQVRTIFNTLPSDLEFRIRAALVDEAGWDFVGQVRYSEWDEERGHDLHWLGGLVNEILIAYPDRRSLCDHFLEMCGEIQSAGMSANSARRLMDALITADPEISHIIIERSLAEANTQIRDYLGLAVGALLESSAEEARLLISQMITSPEPQIRTGGAGALFALRRTKTPADIDLLRQVLNSEDPQVVSIGIAVLKCRDGVDERTLVRLALAIPLDRMPRLLEDVCSLFCHSNQESLDRLSVTEVQGLLGQMIRVPRIDDYWAKKMLKGLSQRHGLLVAEFLLARVDVLLGGGAPEDFRAVDFAWSEHCLGLEESPASGAILAFVWQWLSAHDDDDGAAPYWIGQSLAAMFRLDSPPVVAFLLSRLDHAASKELRWIGQILRHSNHRFVFEQNTFVVRYLERCKAIDAELLRFARSELYCASVSGMWSSAPGEPASRDVEARDGAEAMLSCLSRLSPAYKLYQDLLDHANQRIKEALAEAEAWEEE
ncbi:MAG: helix-turn-helix domain-containing protein [Phaeospirillum sp.]|nr:helix-turn-helix domain-containing protein [Phaeospirillum sp.]